MLTDGIGCLNLSGNAWGGRIEFDMQTRPETRTHPLCPPRRMANVLNVLGCENMEEVTLISRGKSISYAKNKTLESVLSDLEAVLLRALPGGDVYVAIRGSLAHGLAIVSPKDDITPDLDIDLLIPKEHHAVKSWATSLSGESEIMLWNRHIAERVSTELQRAETRARINVQWSGTRPAEISRSFALNARGIPIDVFPKMCDSYPHDNILVYFALGCNVLGQRTVPDNRRVKWSDVPLFQHVASSDSTPRGIAIKLVKYFIKTQRLWVKSYHLAALCDAKFFRVRYMASSSAAAPSWRGVPNIPPNMEELNPHWQVFEGFDSASVAHWIALLWHRIVLTRVCNLKLWAHPSPLHNAYTDISFCDYSSPLPAGKIAFEDNVQDALEPFLTDVTLGPLIQHAKRHWENFPDIFVDPDGRYTFEYVLYVRPSDDDVADLSADVRNVCTSRLRSKVVESAEASRTFVTIDPALSAASAPPRTNTALIEEIPASTAHATVIASCAEVVASECGSAFESAHAAAAPNALAAPDAAAASEVAADAASSALCLASTSIGPLSVTSRDVGTSLEENATVLQIPSSATRLASRASSDSVSCNTAGACGFKRRRDGEAGVCPEPDALAKGFDGHDLA